MIPEFSLHEIRLGPVHLQVFGVLLTLGVITGHMVLVRRARAERLGAVWTIEGFALALGAGALIAALIADRLFGVGLSSIGGLAGAIVAGGSTRSPSGWMSSASPTLRPTRSPLDGSSRGWAALLCTITSGDPRARGSRCGSRRGRGSIWGCSRRC
jgi:hypothetical protein